MFLKIIRLLSSLFIFSLLIYFYFISTPTSKIILLPFVFCALAFVGESLAFMSNRTDLIAICHKLYLISFLTYWFGILLFASYNFIKEKTYLMLLFTIPFWVVGFIILISFLRGR